MGDRTGIQHFWELPRSPPALRPIPDEVCGLRVRLELYGAEPPVWRRVELPGDLTLPRLHESPRRRCCARPATR